MRKVNANDNNINDYEYDYASNSNNYNDDDDDDDDGDDDDDDDNNDDDDTLDKVQSLTLVNPDRVDRVRTWSIWKNRCWYRKDLLEIDFSKYYTLIHNAVHAIRPGSRFTNDFFACNLNSMETSPCCNSFACHQIATNFCTCHDSTAVVPCAKFCSDHCVRIEAKVKLNFHRIWIAMEDTLVKRGPEQPK